MKSIKNAILILIGLFLLYGFGTAFIDYIRLTKGDVPVFAQSDYDSREKIQTYRGIFYKAQRKVKTSPREPLEESTDINFNLFVLKKEIPSTWKEQEKEYTIKVTKSDNCESISTLYYANQNIKVYTTCLDEVQVVKNNKEEAISTYFEKEKDFLESLYTKLAYAGLLSDATTEIYQNRNDGFVSSDIRIYQCNKEFINDIYIVPKDMNPGVDLCTYKDDDFKFISEVVDETPKEVETEYQDLKKKKEEADKKKEETKEEGTTQETNELTEEIVLPEPEVIFEDEKYRYEFDYPKSQYIFVTTPAVRGKMETKTPLMTVINSSTLTINELINKGLKVNKIDKTKETLPE